MTAKRKVCKVCQKCKPLEAFYSAPRYKGGYHPHCRDCHKLRHNARSGKRAAILALNNMPGNKRVVRAASIDCAFTCPLCGMGFDTNAEALSCCEALQPQRRISI